MFGWGVYLCAIRILASIGDERETVAELAVKKGIDTDCESWDEGKIGEYGEFACVVVPDRFTERHATCIFCLDPPVCNEVEEYKRLPCPKCGKDIHVGADGPCHSDEVKKLFWTDVLKSMHVSLETIFAVAREKSFEKSADVLEQRIQAISDQHGV